MGYSGGGSRPQSCAGGGGGGEGGSGGDIICANVAWVALGRSRPDVSTDASACSSQCVSMAASKSTPSRPVLGCSPSLATSSKVRRGGDEYMSGASASKYERHETR